MFEREMENGRGFLWLPVCFGIGILLYFGLPREPSALALGSLTSACLIASTASRARFGLFRLLVVLTFLLAGLTAMKLRTDWVSGPRIAHETTRIVRGWVENRESASRGGIRIMLRVQSIDGFDAEDTPRHVRITIRAGADEIHVGDAVEVTAGLRPLTGPVMPGGYDFGRAAFYEGLGGSGFAYGRARRADLGPTPVAVRLAMPIAELRQLLRERVMSVLPGDPGRIAAALIMGDQGGISDRTQDAMRASGLGHVLSISGLHMALIAGAVFWIVRALLALSTTLALFYPIKKWAAGVALVAATFYLAISGAEVATQRSYIMLAIMLVAVLLDRRAVTLRNVAVAALLVLFISPESLLSVSFQMSFAATVALVAAYEAVSGRRAGSAALQDRRESGWMRRLWLGLFGLTLTSLVAGLATAPFGVFHFQRIAPLSLVANIAAMPAISFIIMPMVILSILLMPLGLEALPLKVMDWGIAWMMRVAEWTTEMSGDLGNIRQAPLSALLLLVAGLLWLALWRERWRYLGLIPILIAPLPAMTAARPDIIVALNGRAAAVRQEDGRYAIIGGKGERFTIENWLRADADPRLPSDPSLEEGIACDPTGCTGLTGDGTLVAVARQITALEEDCRLADIVISYLDVPPSCHARLVIDRRALLRRGAHAISIGQPGDFRVKTAYPPTPRPWMPAYGSGESNQ